MYRPIRRARRALRSPAAAFAAAMLLVMPLAAPALAHEPDAPHPGLTPSSVDATVIAGGDGDVVKTVHTPEIPPIVDVCLLQDETGSFVDDIANLQGGTTASDIYDAVTAVSPGAQFAVAGFRDYDLDPFGSPGDWVYQLYSAMDPTEAAWLAGIAALSAGGGGDIPEAQFDAIVAAAGPGPSNPEPDALGPQDDCGWREGINAVHVLVVTTDASFHVPDGTHQNDTAATLAALASAAGGEGIVVVGLEAPGSEAELDALAAATGGSVQALSSDGANIGAAIVAGLGNLEVEVSMTSDCVAPITTTFVPASQTVTSGDDAVFTETISVAADAAPGVYECRDWALIDGDPMTDADGNIIYETKRIVVAAPFCVETVNPHGGKIPAAPANGGQGQNQDGFYEIGAEPVDEELAVFVLDNATGTLFGPFPTGTAIKYTEANGAMPSIKAMGGNNGGGSGQGVAVAWHIKGQGDASVVFVDSFGNATRAACLVPPPPQ